MQHFRNPLESLRRPRLLISAARFGLAEYDRTPVLRRLLGDSAPATGIWYLAELMRLEAVQNELRLARDAHYSIARHVELLVAVIAEHLAMREGPIS